VRVILSLVFIAILPAFSSGFANAGEGGYLRSPDVHENRVFFTAEGDLWTAPLVGGDAQRLTRHPGEELQVSVSPDGERLAFTASYDGAVEAYVMPLGGGMPTRISFDGARVNVLGWTPDGRVMYASGSISGPSRSSIVRIVNPDTLQATSLPMLEANQAAVDPVSGNVIFTRFGLRMTGDNVRRYRGGAMSQLWAMQSVTATEATRLLADLGANASTPMWWGERIYFLADVSGSANIWSIDRNGADLKQHTDHQAWEVRDPALQGGRIVYQLGADLRLLDIAEDKDQLIPVQLVGDFDLRRKRWLSKPLDYLSSANFSPSGDRVALTARGHAVLAGLGPLRRVEVASPGSTRIRAAVPGAKGDWIYTISDASGQNEIWRFPANGKGDPRQLTQDGNAHRWRLYPSPDGRYLGHDDKNGDLWLLDLESGENRRIYSAPEGVDDAYGPLAWSADGLNIAFSCPGGPRQINQLVMISLSDDGSEVLTSDRYESFSPAFSPDGKWLYFLSDRNFQSYPSHPWGDRNVGPAFDRRGLIFALALQPGNPFPFQSKDELSVDGKPQTDDESDEADIPAIEMEGLARRLFQVPIDPGNFQSLSSGEGHLFVLDRAAGPDQEADLKSIEVTDESPEAESYMAGVSAYALSADREKIFVMKAGESREMYILEAGVKAPDELGPGTVRVADWKLPIDPQAEWRQMFVDAWRMHQQFSFDPNMRGLDWDAVRVRYEPLLKRITDRRELDDLLRQMIGELSLMHSHVGTRDLPSDTEAAAPASLAAEFTSTKDGLQITHMYRSDPELPMQNGPLMRPGVDIQTGDVLTAINGRAVRSPADLVSALDQQAGQQVMAEVIRGSSRHSTIVTPVSMSEHSRLEYLDWVQKSAQTVAQKSAGRIGYLHLRAMGGDDMANFVREYYANHDREGLILDLRSNRGGSIDSWIIEKLLRRVWMQWQMPGGSKSSKNMVQTFRGHLVVLIDQYTYSDGETLAAGIKALEIAPLIGTTTAGAGVWLTDRNRLSDGGIARIAEFPQIGTAGQWLIEGRGVDPDIRVDNLPAAAFSGEDQQLDRAVDYLQEKLARQPIPEFRRLEEFPLVR
jgi:tricorn protease